MAYFEGIYLGGGQRETTINLADNGRRPGRESNQEPPEYKSKVLSIQPSWPVRYSVITIVLRNMDVQLYKNFMVIYKLKLVRVRTSCSNISVQRIRYYSYIFILNKIKNGPKTKFNETVNVFSFTIAWGMLRGCICFQCAQILMVKWHITLRKRYTELNLIMIATGLRHHHYQHRCRHPQPSTP